VGVPGPIVVAVLTRAPSRGGKSRLFAALGRPHDETLLSALLLDTLDGVALPGTTRVVFVDPADACDEVRGMVSPDVEVRAQPEGSLGERMRDTMTTLFTEGASIVVLAGSDLPDITPSMLDDAIAKLRHDPASLVLGPAHDGGYYLIAATSTPHVFDGIEWGSPHVLEQTCAVAERAGLHVQLIDRLHDVDTPEDLEVVAASRTREWVASLNAGELVAAIDRRKPGRAHDSDDHTQR
jgi:rSAM/selenodomain-associated transferase 1